MNVDDRNRNLKGTYKFTHGDINCNSNLQIDGLDLSDYIRDTLDMQTLYVFDGNNKPDDIIEDLEEIVEYKITVEYQKNSKRIIAGIFDKYGLPDDYEIFADKVHAYLAPYGLGLVLSHTRYGATLRRKSDYIYCRVVFNGYGKSYYYVTNDESIQVGDFVSTRRFNP